MRLRGRRGMILFVISGRGSVRVSVMVRGGRARMSERVSVEMR